MGIPQCRSNQSKHASAVIALEKKFGDRLLATLARYRNRSVESAQVIEELIALARDFREAGTRGQSLGLNPAELAFYDALANNESAARDLGDPILKLIAQELTQKLRNRTSVDWQKRESVRARLRNLVRITLRRHRYPPDQQENAIELVLKQAERLSEGQGLPDQELQSHALAKITGAIGAATIGCFDPFRSKIAVAGSGACAGFVSRCRANAYAQVSWPRDRTHAVLTSTRRARSAPDAAPVAGIVGSIVVDAGQRCQRPSRRA